MKYTAEHSAPKHSSALFHSEVRTLFNKVCKCKAFHGIWNFLPLTLLQYQRQCFTMLHINYFTRLCRKWAFSILETLLQLNSWIIQDSNWNNIVFTPVEMIANTFQLFQLGIKESWNASPLPSVPLRREWNQSYYQTSNSSCRTNAMVTGREGEFIYTLLTCFPFIPPASEVPLLCYIQSQKKDWREKYFLLFFLKKHIPCERERLRMVRQFNWIKGKD